jgi:hypothetical protein
MATSKNQQAAPSVVLRKTTGTLVIHRDGENKSIPPNTTFEFTQGEVDDIEKSFPNALSKVVSIDMDDKAAVAQIVGSAAKNTPPGPSTGGDQTL